MQEEKDWEPKAGEDVIVRTCRGDKATAEFVASLVKTHHVTVIPLPTQVGENGVLGSVCVVTAQSKATYLAMQLFSLEIQGMIQAKAMQMQAEMDRKIVPGMAIPSGGPRLRK